MAKIPANISEIAEKANPILRRHKVKAAAVFGSVARGEATAQSDIDFLVDYDDTASILDASALRIALQETFVCGIDLVSRDCVHPLMKDSIFSQAIPIL